MRGIQHCLATHARSTEKKEKRHDTSQHRAPRRAPTECGLDASITPEIAAAIADGRVDPAVMAQIAAANTAGVAGLGGSPNPGLSFLKPPVTAGEPLRLEIESFLASVRSRREPVVTARQGRNALALALEIQAAMVAPAHRAGLGDFFSQTS